MRRWAVHIVTGLQILLKLSTKSVTLQNGFLNARINKTKQPFSHTLPELLIYEFQYSCYVYAAFQLVLAQLGIFQLELITIA